jgi:hypothetical protein
MAISVTNICDVGLAVYWCLCCKLCPMLEIFLFRCSFVKPAQLSILLEDASVYSSPSTIFEKVLNDSGPFSLLETSKWRFTGLRFYDRDSGFFIFGKESLGFVPRYDPESATFFEEEMILGPNTVVYFNVQIGLLGILKRSKLAADTRSVSRRLKKLFSSLPFITRVGIDVVVEPIKDSKEFLDNIEQAYAIKGFKYSFHGPNPFDADKHFHKTLSNIAQEIGAQEGIISVEGTSLDSQVIKEITLSTSASGEAVSAKVQMEPGGSVETIRVKDNPIRLALESSMPLEEILNAITFEYNNRRNQ